MLEDIEVVKVYTYSRVTLKVCYKCGFPVLLLNYDEWCCLL